MVKDVLIEIENAGAEANEIPQVLKKKSKGYFRWKATSVLRKPATF